MDNESQNNNNNEPVKKKNDSNQKEDLDSSRGLDGKRGPHNRNKLNEKDFYMSLRSVRRTRNRLVVCFLTLPVYAIAVYALLENGRSIDGFMYLYMALYLAFGAHMATKRCPNCNNQYYVKLILLNVFTSKCVHCGQSYHQRS